MCRAAKLAYLPLLALALSLASVPDALAGSITGGVRERTTNTPISGATVRLEQSGQIKFTTTTNSSGVYSFTGVPNGTYNLVALKSCYQNWGPSSRNLGDLTGQNIVMEWYPRLSGGVRNNITNNPISGATVRLEQSGQIKYTTTSDANGVYNFTCILAGTYNLVGLKLGEYDNWSQSITLSISTASSQNIAMTPKASISGGVRDNVTNDPITGATVRLEQSGQIKYTTTSDANGVYGISGVTSGSYNLVGLKLGEYLNWSQPRTLAPGENVTNANIAMIPTTARISGGVRDAITNNPIAGATVRLEQNGQIMYTTTSNGTGNYSFAGIPPGDYNLVGLKLGEYLNWSQPRTLNAGDNITSANIAMTPLAKISGGVRDAATSLPISGATVRLEQAGQIKYTTTSDANGVYSITGVVPGDYLLVGLKLGQYQNWSQARTLNAGDDITSANIAMVSLFANISGGVRNILTSAPISGATVRLEENGQIRYTTLSNETGNYAFGGVGPGNYNLVGLKLGEYENWSQARTLNAGDNITAANIAMVPLARISGGVRDNETNAPISGATVRLEQGGQIKHTTTTDPSGAYSITGIIAGDYQLVGLKLGTYQNWSQPRTLNAGDDVQGANIAMAPLRLGFHGKVYSWATGNPPIVAATVQWGAYSTTTDASGDYRFAGIACGSHTLTVSGPGFYTYQAAYDPPCEPDNVKNVALTPQLPATVTVSGLIDSWATGHPFIPGATIRLGSHIAISNGFGDYSIPGVTCGTYVMTVEKAGFYTYQADYAVQCSEPVSKDVRLTPALTTFQGLVHTPAGGSEPIAGASVTWGGLTTTTTSDGMFFFTSRPCIPGPITVSAPAFHPSSSYFTPLCDLPQADLEITLTPVTSPAPLPAPTFSIRDPGDGRSLIVHWVPGTVPGATSYVIEQDDGAAVTGRAVSVAEGQSPWTGLTRRHTYRYRVAATGPNGIGTFSGWQSRAPDYAPILFIHGICSNGNLWTDSPVGNSAFERITQSVAQPVKLADRLVAAGFDEAFLYQYGDVNLGWSVLYDQLDAVIHNVLGLAGADQLVIVAHSQGGLIARALLNKKNYARSWRHATSIRDIIMLGTPNHGSFWARWAFLANHPGFPACQMRSPSAMQMAPGSQFLRVLNYGSSSAKDESCPDSRPDELLYRTGDKFGDWPRYRLYGGTATIWPPPTSCWPTDGVVELRSVSLNNVSLMTDVGLGALYPNLAAHNDAFAGGLYVAETKYAPFAANIESYLKAFMTMPEASRTTASEASTPLSADVTSEFIAAGTVPFLASDWGEASLTVTSCATLEILAGAKPGDCEVQLEAPDHTVYTAADSTSGVIGWSFDPNAGSTRISMDSPSPGTWVLRVRNPAVDASGGWAEYLASGLSEDGVQLALTSASSEAGDPVQVTLTPRGAWSAGSPDNVSAELRDPQGVTTNLVLFDDGAHNDGAAGDGVHGGSFVPAIPGVHLLTARASGTSGTGGIALQRLAVDQIEVADPEDVELTGATAHWGEGGPAGGQVVVEASFSNHSVVPYISLQLVAQRNGQVLGALPIAGISPGAADSTAQFGLEAIDADADSITVLIEVLGTIVEESYENNGMTIPIQTYQVGVGPTPRGLTPGLLLVSPNPSAGRITVRYHRLQSTPGELQLRLYDIAGRVVALDRRSTSEEEVVWQFDATSSVGERARPGVYWLVVREADHHSTRRLVIIR